MLVWGQKISCQIRQRNRCLQKRSWLLLSKNPDHQTQQETNRSATWCIWEYIRIHAKVFKLLNPKPSWRVSGLHWFVEWMPLEACRHRFDSRVLLLSFSTCNVDYYYVDEYPLDKKSEEYAMFFCFCFFWKRMGRFSTFRELYFWYGLGSFFVSRRSFIDSKSPKATDNRDRKLLVVTFVTSPLHSPFTRHLEDVFIKREYSNVHGIRMSGLLYLRLVVPLTNNETTEMTRQRIKKKNKNSETVNARASSQEQLASSSAERKGFLRYSFPERGKTSGFC